MSGHHFSDAELASIRDQHPVSEVAGRLVALKRQGHELVGLCPFHQERSPSFTVNDAKQFYHCFGCGAHGDVFRFVMETERVPFPEAVRRLADGTLAEDPEVIAKRQSKRRAEQEAARRRKLRWARQWWSEGQPLPGTHAEAYLNARRIYAGKGGLRAGWPPTLRFHPGLVHPDDEQVYPALIAAFTCWPSTKVIAVHRVFLDPNGPRKAPVAKPKKTIALASEGAVRLGPAGASLGIGEGLETSLSAMQMYDMPLWARCGSALQGIKLPDSVLEVHIFGDRGEGGEKAVARSIEAYTGQGRRVVSRFPAAGLGNDFNDALQALSAG